MDKIDTSFEEFEKVISLPDEEIDIGRAGLLLSRIAYPELPLEPYLQRFDAMAGEVVRRAGHEAPLLARLDTLFDVVLRENKLTGATTNYYDARNSYLNDVLERRVGIPIALSALLLAVGSRAGVPLAGTAMPMHFLLKLVGHKPPLFIDAYGGGRLLDINGCRRLLSMLSNGRLALEGTMLEAATQRSMLARMLLNLKFIYESRGMFEKTLPILDRLLALDPERAHLHRERGLLHYELGETSPARRDLSRYLVLAGDPPDAQQIKKILQRLNL